MRLSFGVSCLTLAAVSLSAILFLAPSAQAGRVAERSYADSFGNLVILSPSGYKRILVGKGHLATGYAAEDAYDDPHVLYFSERDRARSQYRHPQTSYRCSRGAAVFRGRSFMYGLSRDEVPVLGGDCH